VSLQKDLSIPTDALIGTSKDGKLTTAKNLAASKIIPWLIPASLITLWIVLSQAGLLKDSLFPNSGKVLKTFLRMLRDGLLFEYLLVSARRALTGFFLGGGIGFLLGLSNGLSQRSDAFLDTTLQMFRNIPNLALMPLLILWCGIGEETKVIMVAIATFFPLYVNTKHGIRSIDKGLIEMGKVYGLKGFALFRHVIFPGATSSVLVGVRYALGIMWLVMIAAESLAADSGIGFMATRGRELFQMDIIILSIILYAILGKLSDTIAKFIEHRLLRWNPEFRKK
jgi:sulfonate transport system permease protein